GPTEGLPARLGPLYGFVRTTKKPSEAVLVPIQTPEIGKQTVPILAYWHYGLGKAAGFPSGARPGAGLPRARGRDRAHSGMVRKIWEEVVDWSVRAEETGRLTLRTEQRDGKVRVILDARDRGRPLTGLKLRAAVTRPSLPDDAPGKPKLEFRSTNSGEYEAE